MKYIKILISLLLLFSFAGCHKIEKSEATPISIEKLSSYNTDLDLRDYFNEEEIKALALVYNNGENKQLVFRLVQEAAFRKVQFKELENYKNALYYNSLEAKKEYDDFCKNSNDPNIKKVYETKSIMSLSASVEAESIYCAALTSSMRKTLDDIREQVNSEKESVK